jgi:hypothetical protein
MFADFLAINRRSGQFGHTMWMLAMAFSLSLFFADSPASAQDQTQTPPQTNDNGKPKQDAPAEAGGPSGDIGPYAIPKKNPDEAPPPPPPPTPKKVEGLPDYSIKVNSPLVNVDVLVTTKAGEFVPGLKKENFRLFEDGAAQAINTFNVSKAPITAVLLVEYASTNYGFMIQALQASYSFANTLQKDDCAFPASPRPTCLTPCMTRSTASTGLKARSTSFS